MSASPARSFLVVGLTGGIATGKSTVAAMFRGLGAVVIDADQLAREVVEPGEPALDEIKSEFGAGVLTADGRLDREALGAIVFADPERRQRLETITHPRIRDRLARHLDVLATQGFDGIVFFDAPVIVESGYSRSMDRLVVVTADAATQRARLMARDGIGGEEADRKVRSQMPLAEKAKLADYVIDNSGDPAATEAQAQRIYEALAAEVSVARDAIGGTRIGEKPTSRVVPLGVMFPVNMGNRGQNELDCTAVFKRLTNQAYHVQFLAYHWRRSGNFVFWDADEDARRAAAHIGQQVTGLRCVVRGFPQLVRLNWSVPLSARTERGSVLLRERGSVKRLIGVFLSGPVPERTRPAGCVRTGIEILAWASESELLCSYERPREAGDVGQVTRAVIEAIKKYGGSQELFGSGRGVGVLRDLLTGRGLTRT